MLYIVNVSFLVIPPLLSRARIIISNKWICQSGGCWICQSGGCWICPPFSGGKLYCVAAAGTVARRYSHSIGRADAEDEGFCFPRYTSPSASAEPMQRMRDSITNLPEANCIVLPPPSRRQADAHRASAFRWVRIPNLK